MLNERLKPLSYSILAIILAIVVLHLLILNMTLVKPQTLQAITVEHEMAYQQTANIIKRIKQQSHSQNALLQSIFLAMNKKNSNQASITLTNVPSQHVQFKTLSVLKPYYLAASSKQSQLAFSYIIHKNLWLNYQKLLPNHIYSPLIVLFFATFILLLIIILYSGLISHFSLPLQHFKSVASTLGVEGFSSQPVHEFGPALAKETAQAMNKMQQRIEDLLQKRTQLLATISHDLRTPLTRIKIRTHCLTENKDITTINQDIDDMEAMIEEILSYAREDNNQDQSTKFDINAVFNAVCDDFIDTVGSINVQYKTERLVISGRRLAIRRALENVFRNAFHYAKTISADLTVMQQSIIITIKDRGPGIPDSEFDNVFAPYYRGEVSKQHRSTGTGLGLTTVKMIIEGHGGKITLSNREGGGLSVNISLPFDQYTKD